MAQPPHGRRQHWPRPQYPSPQYLPPQYPPPSPQPQYQPPPPPPPRRNRGPRVVFLTLGVVFCLVAAGAVIALVRGSAGGYDPNDPNALPSTSSVAASVPQSEVADLEDTGSGTPLTAWLGTAVVQNVQVVLGNGAVRAFDVATGERRWEAPVPGNALCGYTTSEDAIYLQMRSPDAPHSCGRLIKLDAAGNQLWDRELADSIEKLGSFSDSKKLGLADGRLIVVNSTEIVSLSTEDGSMQWHRTLDRQSPEFSFYAESEYGTACNFEDAMVGGGDVVTTLRCSEGSTWGEGEDDVLLQRRSLTDGNAGEPGSVTGAVFEDMPFDSFVLVHVSEHGTVHAARDPAKGGLGDFSTLHFLAPEGNPRGTYELPGSTVPGMGYRETSPVGNPVVVGDLMIVMTGVHNPVAFRISTGEKAWEAPLRGNREPRTGIVWGSAFLLPTAKDELTAYDIETGQPREEQVTVDGLDDLEDFSHSNVQSYDRVGRYLVATHATTLPGNPVSVTLEPS